MQLLRPVYRPTHVTRKLYEEESLRWSFEGFRVDTI
jgi:hypothetical protein